MIQRPVPRGLSIRRANVRNGRQGPRSGITRGWHSNRPENNAFVLRPRPILRMWIGLGPLFVGIRTIRQRYGIVPPAPGRTGLSGECGVGSVREEKITDIPEHYSLPILLRNALRGQRLSGPVVRITRECKRRPHHRTCRQCGLGFVRRDRRRHQFSSVCWEQSGHTPIKSTRRCTIFHPGCNG